jgi:hypothetical protein
LASTIVVTVKVYVPAFKPETVIVFPTTLTLALGWPTTLALKPVALVKDTVADPLVL